MAKRFTFRIEPVLKLRRQRERMALRKLAEARGHMAEIEGRIRALQVQMRRQNDLVRQGVLTGTVDVEYMSRYRLHVMALHRALIEQAHGLKAAAVHMQEVRTEVMAAVKDRKVLSRLKEKLQDRHRRRQDHLESLQADERSTSRHNHLRLAGQLGEW